VEGRLPDQVLDSLAGWEGSQAGLSQGHSQVVQVDTQVGQVGIQVVGKLPSVDSALGKLVGLYEAAWLCLKVTFRLSQMITDFSWIRLTHTGINHKE